MITTKHTSGNWSTFCSKDKTYLIDTDKGIIGEVYGHEETDIYENLANAKLIAAAPELLKSLIKLYDAIGSCVDLTPELLRECDSVIKKATK